jgi:hypothetical protein
VAVKAVSDCRRALRQGLGVVGVALCLAGCGGGIEATRARPFDPSSSSFAVAVEGPCSKLSMQAVGERRFLVYGETGYDLRGWLPGDSLAAAQSLAELRDGRLSRNRALLEGLPTNAGGYVPADLALGGSFERGVWLLAITAHYAPFERGVLFEREVEGFELRAHGWERASGALPVDMPPEASRLPALAADSVCGKPGLSFIALASAVTRAGGVLVAGQCDERKPTRTRQGGLLVAHGRPNASEWALAELPRTDELDGIVNLDLYARSDDDAVLVAYEPFRQLHERRHYLARYDGSSWRAEEPEVDDGLMSVDGADDGSLWAAGSRALYFARKQGVFEKIALPPLRFATAKPADLHVHTVHVLAPDEIWVEASYRVALPAPDGRGTAPAWAGALFGTRKLSHTVVCDAREPAESALFEVE